MMEEDRTPSAEEPTVTEMKREGDGGGKRPSAFMLIGVFVVLGLIITGLFLPPISLGDRLGLTGDSTAETTTEETTAATPEATAASSLSIPGEVNLAVSNGVSGVNVASEPSGNFVNNTPGATIPSDRAIVGNVYTINHDGTASGQASVVIPPGAAPETVDLFGWNGTTWEFIPSTVNTASQEVVSQDGVLPQALALMSATAATQPAIGAEILPAQTLPVETLPYLTEVMAGTLTLNQDGTVLGEVTAVPTGAYSQFIRVTNTGAIVDQTSLSALLSNPELQTNHINDLVQRATTGGYAGINLDYQGVAANQQEAFSTFVGNLAAALHENNLELAVTLATPLLVNNAWDTAGQNWAAIGKTADLVYLQMPLDPAAYTSDEATQLLGWATRQVDRQKLTALVSASAVDHLGEFFRELSNEQALTNFGSLQFVQGAAEVEPETAVEVAFSGNVSPLEWDGGSVTYKYTYDDAGQTHTVWLGNAAALGQRFSVIQPFNLRGVAVRGLGTVTNGVDYATALQSYLGTAQSPQPPSAAIVWKVEGADASVLASGSGEALTFAWEGTAEPGTYTIKAEFALGENIASLGTVDVAVIAPVVEATPETTTTPEAALAEASVTPAAGSGATGTAVVKTGSNLRLGPGLGYGTVAGGVQANTEVTVIGRNDDATWLLIRLPDNQTEAWIYATLLTIDPGLDLMALDVVEATAVAANPPTSGGTPAPAAPAPPVSVAPVANTGFELGGQTHTLANPQLMSYAGMRWVKFQHKWGPGDTPDSVAGRIQQAHANGFKVLLSIPGANTYPSSIEFNEYVNFLGGVAALGPDAIEVWNEMNIDFEWPAGQIDPTSYVNNMLAPAYNKIKAANASVMVVSGAPAPTGFDNGTNAWADDRYMAGMAAAGAANYMDCIGVHHNAGATSPSAVSGHPTGSAHYSWYFFPTLNMYYNAFGGSRPVCFTELGYLSGEDFGGVPSRFAWAGSTTVAQQAQWLAEAASLAGNSGKVRMMIIFNVDFTVWGDDPQAGYAMIRPSGSCPACETLRQVMGGG